MSAAEKVVAVAAELPTRGMGGLADCPLARAYGWHAPIEDYRPRRYVAPAERTRVSLPIVPARVVRSVVGEVVTRVLPQTAAVATPQSPPVLAKHRRPAHGNRKSSTQIDALVADYLALCDQPFAYGQLKELAHKHGYSDSHVMMMALKSRGVWRNRKAARGSV